MKTVAVLGLNGQLGQTLKYLVGDSNTGFSFYTKEQLDITNKASIEQILNQNKFDFCINCAAYTNVELAESDHENAFLVNATGVEYLAEVCKAQQIKLIHISTDYVFDGTKAEPYKTSDITNPLNFYGRSKLKGEQNIQEILKEHYIIRTSWLYSIYGKNFMKTIINKISEDKLLTITTEETGTPTSCLDLARFILHVVTSEDVPYGTYHFSAKGSTTWFGFAKAIAQFYDTTKIDLITDVQSFKTIAKRPKHSVLDISKTEKVYSKSMSTWQDSLRETVELFKSQASLN